MNLTIGQVVSGTVTGIRSYGAFVQINDSSRQGLIHISEFRNGYVDDISDFLHLGQVIQVRILNIDEYDEKISLSLRALKPVSYDSQHYNRKSYWTDQQKNIGYHTIAKHKEAWIKEELQKIEKKSKKCQKGVAKGEKS